MQKWLQWFALVAVCSGVVGIRTGLDQQVTKESQDSRGGTWPPPALFEVPDPVDLLTSALEYVHRDDVKAALGALQKAAHVTPNSHEVAMHLGFLYCAMGNENDARKHLQRALPPQLQAPAPGAVAAGDGPFEVGDTVLEADLRARLSIPGSTCVPLPLLYPSKLVVQETIGEVKYENDESEIQYTRVYFLDRLDGEGSMVVKQTSTLAAAREAFVLLELRYSAGDKDDGAPPCFPSVFGSLVTRRWSACAVSNFEGAVPLATRVAEEPSVFNETGVAFDIFDRLLLIIQQMQGAGVTHRALSSESSVVMLAGDVPGVYLIYYYKVPDLLLTDFCDVPALVHFEYAVAQGMPFAAPRLPPEAADTYRCVPNLLLQST